MAPDLGNRFQSFALTPEEEKMAVQVSPYFMAYLQNKIAAYASAAVSTELPYDPDPKQQVVAIVAHERVKNFVEAYEELLRELQDAAVTQTNYAQE